MRLSEPSASRTLAAAVIAAVTLVASAGGPTWSQQEATFSGAIFDPVGKGQPGFQLVLVDDATGREYVSGKSGPSGVYAMSVPVGARYRVAAVIAPDGTHLAVQDLPPIAVRVPGNNHLDVRFQMKTIAPDAAGSSTTSSRGASDHKKSAVPWWKTPGGVTGIVVGAAAVAALALSGGGGHGGTVSPSAP